ESQAAKKLNLIARQIREYKEVSFYMDELLINPNRKHEQKKIGLGWVASVNNFKKETSIAEFSGMIKDWPSATRAKLDTIWTAQYGILLHNNTDALAKEGATGVNIVVPNWSWTNLNKIDLS
ncbi:19388_t:CDS:2, partial [Gigaspora margarita]